MRSLFAIVISLSVVIASMYAFSHRESVPLSDSVIPINSINITDLTPTEAGMLAAGELGHILISTDQGASWKKTNIDKQRHALITRMSFKDKEMGLAIGHEGWILRTIDGGLNWNEVRFNDKNSDPLFDVKLLPNGQWLAVGAFGQVLISEDDGLTWLSSPAPQGTDWHLNSFIASEDSDKLLLTGEAGTLFITENSGQDWQQIPEFYTGSFYGGLHLGGSDWLLYGMRGNIYKSRDDGQSWQRIEMNIPISLFSHLKLPDGRLLLVGQGGFIFESINNGDSFTLLSRGKRVTLTDIKLLQDGKLLLSSDAGLSVQTIPKSKNAHSSPSQSHGVKS